MNARKIGVMLFVGGFLLIGLAQGLLSLLTAVGMSSPHELDNVQADVGETLAYSFRAYNNSDEKTLFSVGASGTLPPYTTLPQDFWINAYDSQPFSLSFTFPTAGIYEGYVSVAAFPTVEAQQGMIIVGLVSVPARFAIGGLELPAADTEVMENNFIWGHGDEDFCVVRAWESELKDAMTIIGALMAIAGGLLIIKGWPF